jgi:hypothetical protein
MKHILFVLLCVGALTAAPITVSGSGKFYQSQQFSSCDISFGGSSGAETLSVEQHARSSDCSYGMPGYAGATYSDGRGFAFTGSSISYFFGTTGGLVTLYDPVKSSVVLREISILGRYTLSGGVTDEFGDTVYTIKITPPLPPSDPTQVPEPASLIVVLPLLGMMMYAGRAKWHSKPS